MMTSRQRFLSVLNGEQPDRPPIFANLTPQAAEKLSNAVGVHYEPPVDSMLSTRISHPNLLTTLGNDCVGIAANAPDDFPTRTLTNGLIENEWGMKFKNVGLYNEFAEFPLAHAENAVDIENYNFPDPFAAGRYRSALETNEKYGDTHGIIADLETSFFETAWYLVGLEKLLMDMMAGADYVPVLFDKIMGINIDIGKKLIEIGADMIWCGDDFGSQDGMLISPELWRELFKPRIKYMFEHFKSVNPDVKLAWHSCGSIVPIIPDFIDIGLEVLNPLQPLAKSMDPDFIKSNFGKDLIFFGGIDIQELLPHATPEQIHAEVSHISKILGKNGGYIIAPAHNIQDDTPVENVLAFFEAAKRPPQKAS
jgi:uroporphyrinogen decarboxylase